MGDILKLADYGIGIVSIAVLAWVCAQVFTVIKCNTAALQELIVLIRQQATVVQQLAEQVKDLQLLICSKKD